METLAVLAGLLSMLVSLIVGGRLIRLAGRTHQAPELLIGLSLVLLGCGWSALVAIGRQAAGLPDAIRVGSVAIGALCGIAGTTCLAIFNWRVFRPGVAWAPILAGAIALAMIALFGAQSLGSGWLVFARDEQGPWTNVTWIGVVNYAWSSLEAWRQHRMLVRRQQLGLADPVVANRVRLWTITMLAALLATLAFSALQTLGIPLGGTALGLGLAAIVALVSAGCLWLAFVPPSAYLASVRRRALAAA